MLAAPGLEDIPDLARRAGLYVDVADAASTPRRLPTGMDLAAFRIVQEALTNVLKHSGTDRGRVEVTYSADAVAVEVTDGRRGRSPGAARRGDGRPGARALSGCANGLRCTGASSAQGRCPGRGYRSQRPAARPGPRRDDLRRDRRRPGPGASRVPCPGQHRAPTSEVVGEAGTGQEAVAVARRTRPDVVLMDIRMPKMDGIEATEHILAQAPIAQAPIAQAPIAQARGPRVMILTTFDLDEYVFAALRAGASGFLLKDTPPEDLLAAIRVMASR